MTVHTIAEDVETDERILRRRCVLAAYARRVPGPISIGDLALVARTEQCDVDELIMFARRNGWLQ